MNAELFLQLFKGDLQRFFRSKVGIFWTIGFPLLLLFLFTQLFGQNARPLGEMRVVFADRDQTEQSLALVQIGSLALQSTNGLVARVERAEACPRAVLCVEIPPGYGKALESGGAAPIEVRTGNRSGAQPEILFAIVRSVLDGQVIAHRVTGDRPQARRIGTGSAAASAASTSAYFATGLLTMSILTTALMGFAVPIVYLRENRLFDMYQIMPIPKSTFMGAFVASRLAIILLLAAVFVAVSAAFLGVHVDVGAGHASMGIAALIVGSLCFISQGLLVASRIATVASATMVCNALYFLQTFLGDLFVPLAGLPDWLRSSLSVLPAKYVCDALRLALNGDEPVSRVASHIAILLAWTAAFLVLTRIGFVWKRKTRA